MMFANEEEAEIKEIMEVRVSLKQICAEINNKMSSCQKNKNKSGGSKRKCDENKMLVIRRNDYQTSYQTGELKELYQYEMQYDTC